MMECKPKANCIKHKHLPLIVPKAFIIFSRNIEVPSETLVVPRDRPPWNALANSRLVHILRH